MRPDDCSADVANRKIDVVRAPAIVRDRTDTTDGGRYDAHPMPCATTNGCLLQRRALIARIAPAADEDTGR